MEAKNTTIWAPVCILMALVCASTQTSAQTEHVHSSTWLMPTISYTCSDRLKLVLQGNWIPQEHLIYTYANALFRVNKHLTLNTGYMYIKVPERDELNKDQSTFLTGLILSYPVSVGKISVENRVLSWNRFINNSEDQHLFLDRIRFIKSGKVFQRQLAFYIFDEVSFDCADVAFSRNRVGGGINFECSKWFLVDVAIARQNDHNGGELNLIFLALMLQIPH